MDSHTPADIENLSTSSLRELVVRRLRSVEDREHGDHFLNPGFRDWVMDRAKRPAAVLVPFVERSGSLNIILTKRVEHLRSHSGQIAFPGGKIDPEDADARDAALREAREEIDLRPEDVEIIGQMPDYHTGSGYRISPVLGIVDPAARMKANPVEVDYVFEVPLAFLMDPANHLRGSREFGGGKRYFFEMPYDDHYIWGVTANMLHMLYERLFK